VSDYRDLIERSRPMAQAAKGEPFADLHAALVETVERLERVRAALGRQKVEGLMTRQDYREVVAEIEEAVR
jgi:hypothetical protein